MDPATHSVTSYTDAQIDTGSDFTIVGANVVQGLNLRSVGPDATLSAGAPGAGMTVKQFVLVSTQN